MIVETHNHLKDPQRIKASRVVIYHDDGTPLCVVVLSPLGGYEILRAGEPGFSQTLRVLGIDRTVVVEPLEFKPQKGLNLKDFM